MFTLVERPFGINGVGLCVVDTLSFEARVTCGIFLGVVYYFLSFLTVFYG